MTTYISNILPSKSINFQSPLYMLYNKNPSYSHLRVFGCLCFPLFPSNTIHKLQPHSTPCVFLEYSSNHHGYKCLDMTTNKIITCRHVLFDESTFPYAKMHTPQSTTYTFLDNDLSPYLINHILTQDQNNSLVPPSKPNTSPNMTHTTPLPNTLPQTIRPTTPSNRPESNSTPTLNSSLPSPQSNHTLQNNLPPIYQPTAQANTKPITRSQHAIFKPNKKYYNLLTHVTKSPLPRNPVSALKDPN